MIYRQSKLYPNPVCAKHAKNIILHKFEQVSYSRVALTLSMQEPRVFCVSINNENLWLDFTTNSSSSDKGRQIMYIDEGGEAFNVCTSRDL